jgi:hypothetical protein
VDGQDSLNRFDNKFKSKSKNKNKKRNPNQQGPNAEVKTNPNQVKEVKPVQQQQLRVSNEGAVEGEQKKNNNNRNKRRFNKKPNGPKPE